MTELFNEDGCLTDEGLRALIDGELDELSRLEAAEHLSYCDKCLDRYTALLTPDALKAPPRGVIGAVMGTVWVRVMRSTWGRAAVACAAALLAFTMWRSGAVQSLDLSTWEPPKLWPAQPQQAEEAALGRPYETKQEKRQRALDAIQQLIGGADAAKNDEGDLQ